MAVEIEILYEDDDLVFVNKPAGLLVQQAHDLDEPDLHQIMSDRADETSHAFLVQRLDRGTSGTMFFSKNRAINAKLNRAFERKQIRKRYLALVEGSLSVPQLIDAPIVRTGAIRFSVREDGKRALTRLRPAWSTVRGSLLEIDLLTGRTHQIRVHLSSIGHPLIGDWLYGVRDDSIRPMLHAASVRMEHPSSGAELEVKAPLPDDFRTICDDLGIDLTSQGDGGSG